VNILYKKGQVVYSKAGHDKGKPFIVFDCKENYLYLVDGDSRKLEKPKKKKIIHVQAVNFVDDEINEKLTNNLYIDDAQIRKVLKAYQN